MNKYFIPKHMKNNKSNFRGRTGLASIYYKFGNEFKEMAQDEIDKKNRKFNNSNYVIPSIIMYCSSFEAFMNETLASSRIINELPKYHSDEIDQLIDLIKSEGDFKKKLKNFYYSYDKVHSGIDRNSLLYSDLIALFKLRNEFVHYNPESVEITKYPIRVQEAYKQLKLNITEPIGWVSYFCNIETANWAKQTIKKGIENFCEISKSINPFKVPYPFNWDDDLENKK